MRAARTVTVVLPLLCLASLSAAQAPGLSPEDVMRISVVTAVYPHPVDAGVLAFTRSVPRPPGDVGSSRSILWVRNGDGVETPLFGDRSTRGVAWLPDGSALSFVDQADGDEHPEVYAVDRDRLVSRITRTPHGVSSYRWRPDGEALAYTVVDPLEPAQQRAAELGFKPRIVDEDYRQVSLWLWDRATGESTRLTEGVTVLGFEWSPTGTHLAAAIAPSSLVDDSYMFTRLHLVDPATGVVELLVDNPGKLGGYAWSPDGTALAYISAQDRNDPHAGMLFRVNLSNREPQLLTPDFEGMVQQVCWPSNDRLRVLVSKGVHSEIDDLNADTGAIEDIVWSTGAAAIAVHSFTPTADEKHLALVASTATSPDNVWLLEQSGMFERWTDEANAWLADRALGQQRAVTFRARDGLAIEGILMYPVGYREGERYPMVIVAHGGPEAHFSNGWNTDYGRWGQMLCARGYFAWYPNYRASTGYGVAFAKKDHGDPMGAEFNDHLDAIAHFANQGLVDPDRVGIGGGSYGGYTAAWAATRHSAHFAAAVSFVPFTDIRTKWLTTDIPYEFYYVHYQERWPHQQPGLLADRSPLSWAAQCDTPLLLLGGTADPRVHPSQPFMLYRAVKFATDTPVRYVQYPGEGHGNRSNVYRYDYAVRTLRWFDWYLQPDRRDAAPPPWQLDYSAWQPAAGEDDGPPDDRDG